MTSTQPLCGKFSVILGMICLFFYTVSLDDLSILSSLNDFFLWCNPHESAGSLARCLAGLGRAEWEDGRFGRVTGGRLETKAAGVEEWVVNVLLTGGPKCVCEDKSGADLGRQTRQHASKQTNKTKDQTKQRQRRPTHT